MRRRVDRYHYPRIPVSSENGGPQASPSQMFQWGSYGFWMSRLLEFAYDMPDVRCKNCTGSTIIVSHQAEHTVPLHWSFSGTPVSQDCIKQAASGADNLNVPCGESHSPSISHDDKKQQAIDPGVHRDGGLVNLLPTIISSELPWSTRHPGNAASTFIQAVYTKPAPIFAPPVGSHATRGILLAPAAWELGHLTVTWAVIFTKTTGYLLGFMHAIHGALEPPDLPLPLALHIVISSRVDGLVGDLLKGLRNSAGPPLAFLDEVFDIDELEAYFHADFAPCIALIR
ncbi:hypothetical protein ONZ51_g8038 [Trametes cubensis]|uniref:Uncharacterized protein n=1 Tax=Trametes cubensis TaxID=1111947 RepID=A0AAD7X6W5_9APHY|nr:hypothetical protein ONZ51_g8038 [Trametes cubensis]